MLVVSQLLILFKHNYLSFIHVILFFTAILAVAPNSRFLTIDKLKPGTSYTIKMQALNGAGKGPLSDVIIAKTLDVPKAVSNIRQSFTGATLVLNWDAPTG